MFGDEVVGWLGLYFLLLLLLAPLIPCGWWFLMLAMICLAFSMSVQLLILCRMCIQLRVRCTYIA